MVSGDNTYSWDRVAVRTKKEAVLVAAGGGVLGGCVYGGVYECMSV